MIILFGVFFSKGKRKNNGNKVKSNEDGNMQEYVLSAQTGTGMTEKVERWWLKWCENDNYTEAWVKYMKIKRNVKLKREESMTE